MNPSQKGPFTLASIRHQNLAVAQFASHLSNINSDNCHAAVLFASFTFITAMFSFASRHRDGAASLDDIAQCFILVQGVSSILSSPKIWSAIASGPIAPLVSMPPAAAPPVGAFAARLKALGDIVRPPPMSPGNGMAVASSSTAAVEALQNMGGVETVDTVAD
ncbi:C6 zinc finger domain-containing protein [Lasiodiplodia theobromae]|uniref:C6 zinc finger domain-containing protein n=1 Tax=Lasiodiplodia theobromae TaxID=45133 RepID=UPI0015C2E975|nr:C6 zinc finger domain-containing protein [Lasiodiplodia theobromae]KAF4541610.1 C6 zinc finger domain-containing protein [Lasiodiplodia theobromae]